MDSKKDTELQKGALRVLPYAKIPHARASGRKMDSADEYVATEKVHGANFWFLVCGFSSEHVHFGYRKGELRLSDGKSFHHYEDVVAVELPRVRAIADSVRSSHPGTASVWICGELFGGAYRGMEPKYTSGVPVQQRTNYSPGVHFYAFDMFRSDIDARTAGDGALERERLTLDECAVHWAKAGPGFLSALVVARGTYRELMDVDIENLQTGIPARLGLPPLPDNRAEGIVLRAVFSGEQHKRVGKAFSEVVMGKKKKKNNNNKAPDDSKRLEYVCQQRLDKLLPSLGYEPRALRDLLSVVRGEPAPPALASELEKAAEESKTTVPPSSGDGAALKAAAKLLLDKLAESLAQDAMADYRQDNPLRDVGDDKATRSRQLRASKSLLWLQLGE